MASSIFYRPTWRFPRQVAATRELGGDAMALLLITTVRRSSTPARGRTFAAGAVTAGIRYEKRLLDRERLSLYHLNDLHVFYVASWV